jgi:hypothetical protein
MAITDVAKWMNQLLGQYVILKGENTVRFLVTKHISVSISRVENNLFQAVVIVALERGEIID